MKSMDMKRRSFLKLAAAGVAAGAGAAMVGCSPTGSTEEAAQTAQNGTASVESTEIPTENTLEAAETVECDLVVIGSGMSGMSATLEAAELGLNVVLVERLTTLGGTLFGTEGILGVGSQMQKDAGIEAEEYWTIIKEELNHTNWRSDPLMWSDFIKASGEDIDFLVEHGAIISKVDDYNGASTYPNFHWWEDGAGTSTSAALAESVQNSGATVMLETALIDLKLEGGKVTGAYVQRSDDSIVEINAHAVLIAAGGSSNNFELLEERSGMIFPDAESPFELQLNGDGIILAAKYGASKPPIAGLNVFTAYNFHAQSPIAVAARMEPISLLVNAAGERFAPEDVTLVYRFSVATNLLGTQDGKCWSVLDQAGVDYLEKGPGNFIGTVGFKPGEKLVGLTDQFAEGMENENPYVLVCDTIDELAEAIGADPATLKETIDHYNELCEVGKDTDFGKQADYLLPIAEGPFYALSPIMSFFSTMGGIDVDRDMHVLRDDGTWIEGLYASGVGACGLYKETYNYAVSGGQNAFCCYSGRQAARKVAESMQ